MRTTMKTPQKKKNPALLKRQRQEWARIGVQILFFLCAPSLYASAFSGVKNAFSALGGGTPLEMTSFSIQLLLLLGFTILFGRWFCGWACAFGALGDWVYRFSQWIQKKTGRRLPKLPEGMIPVLQWVKCGVLTFLLVLCMTGNSPLIGQHSPWTVFSLLRSGHFALSGHAVGVLLLCLILLGMAVQERFFCQILCPMGAVFALLPIMPLFQLKRKSADCPANCGACKRMCPVSYQLDADSIRQGECIRCGRCCGICPRKNISTFHGLLHGNEVFVDVIKGLVLLILIFALNGGA